MESLVSRVAQCSPETAFALMSNFENDHLWWTGVITTTRISTQSDGVGTRYRQRNKLLGLRFDIEVEVTRWEPPSLIGFRNTTGPAPFEGTYTFEPVDGGTRVTLKGVVDARGLFRLAVPLFKWHLTRVTERYFDNLKRLLDARGAALRS